MITNEELNFPNIEQKFFQEIEEIVQQSNTSYIDAVIHWCQRNDVETEYISSFIANNVPLRAKIQSEAEDLHFLKRIPRLPI